MTVRDTEEGLLGVTPPPPPSVKELPYAPFSHINFVGPAGVLATLGDLLP